VEATASSYVVSPPPWPRGVRPWAQPRPPVGGLLIALAARVVREVSDLATRARETGKRLATLSIDTENPLPLAAERAQFSSELTAAITQLAARYHDASALGGRPHRLVLVAHPYPKKTRRLQYEREERSQRTPFRAGGSGSTGHPEQVWEAIATGPARPHGLCPPRSMAASAALRRLYDLDIQHGILEH